MTRKQFLKARNAYLIAKAACETAKENANNAERAFMERRGYGSNQYIWTVDVDETTFDTLCEAFVTEYANENATLRAAESALNEAEKAFANIAITDVPLPPTELTTFKQKVNTSAAIRAKVIDFALKLDTQTIPV